MKSHVVIAAVPLSQQEDGCICMCNDACIRPVNPHSFRVRFFLYWFYGVSRFFNTHFYSIYMALVVNSLFLLARG